MYLLKFLVLPQDLGFVCHSVHGGGGCLVPRGCLVPGGSGPEGGLVWSWGVSGPGGCLVLGGAWSRGVACPGRGLVDYPPLPDGYCCGRCSSYWNALLFTTKPPNHSTALSLLHWFTLASNNLRHEQESISVGCVPPTCRLDERASVATRCQHWRMPLSEQVWTCLG